MPHQKNPQLLQRIHILIHNLLKMGTQTYSDQLKDRCDDLVLALEMPVKRRRHHVHFFGYCGEVQRLDSLTAHNLQGCFSDLLSADVGPESFFCHHKI